jgi:glycyl-tRNA synthetase beta chain
VESALAQALAAAHHDTAQALRRGDYADALARLAQLQVPVDAFFDGVMVNADDARVRANRLALLGQLSMQFGAIADISRL